MLVYINASWDKICSWHIIGERVKLDLLKFFLTSKIFLYVKDAVVFNLKKMKFMIKFLLSDKTSNIYARWWSAIIWSKDKIDIVSRSLTKTLPLSIVFQNPEKYCTTIGKPWRSSTFHRVNNFFAEFPHIVTQECYFCAVAIWVALSILLWMVPLFDATLYQSNLLRLSQP